MTGDLPGKARSTIAMWHVLTPSCSALNPGPNPDISGIGIRVSIYTQAFLGLVPLMLFAVDGKITRSERKVLDGIYANILVTACALLISASVQAATFGLTVYHALIVLNLSWINNSGAVTWSYIDDESGKENRKIWARLPVPVSNGLTLIIK